MIQGGHAKISGTAEDIARVLRSLGADACAPVSAPLPPPAAAAPAESVKADAAYGVRYFYQITGTSPTPLPRRPTRHTGCGISTPRPTGAADRYS